MSLQSSRDWWGKDVRSSLGSALLAAAALAIAAAPAGAQLNFSNSYTFLKAVKERDSQKATDLLASPSSTVINTKEAGSGNGALHILARERDGTWLNFLLTKGAKADLQNAGGDTALLIATQIGWAEGADILLRRGANVELANRQGETPLILAVQNRDIALVRLLLAKGANPKRTDSVAGYSALDYAKRDGARGASILKLLEAPPAKPAREVVGPKL
jgi:ankyrin repeat protein